MGFLAPAAPFVPMLVGAGVGAIADKDNPLRGAMLGAVGGSVLGPSMAALAPAGAAAESAALGAGMAPEAAAAAAQYVLLGLLLGRDLVLCRQRCLQNRLAPLEPQD